ncbi:MAG: 23S rRNA (adenine(2503)-C(2))-methyltransferase RlmN [Patescibacteria group bacterium]|nr:MAG: 23S rRNA (adenine(2503)-C(2))-methyltransferase RlmN [Patescibacteria group bacterium]
MHLDTLATALAGEPAYRIKQASELVFRGLISDWDEASSLPLDLRAKLKAEVPISTLVPVQSSTSSKGDTQKTLFRLTDGQQIEAVLMRHEGERNTVCVSSQAGCPMACAFCATGTMGLKRNLESHEIVEQVLHYARLLKREGDVLTNVVLMGMGEPFHNYDRVMDALRLMNDPKGLAFGVRRMSISTCGIVPGILKLADDPMRVNLAISLHAPNDDLRSRLMPVNKAYPLAKLFDAIKTYIRKTNRKVMFEYLLIEGVNDTPEIAEELADLLCRENPDGSGDPTPLYHVNLIKYHATEVLGSAAERFGLPVDARTGKGTFPSSPLDRRRAFQQILYDRGISVTHRITFGEDIDAACGQLANKET